MEKLDKKKVLAVVLVLALTAALAGAVSLLYNSIDLFSNTPFSGSSDKPSQYYTSLQKPLAIILAFAAAVAFTGVGAGIASFIVKNQKAKTACLVISLVAVAAFLAFIIASSCIWTGNYKNDEYGGDRFPHYVANTSSLSQRYAIYSGVMAALIPQLVYFAVIAAVLLTVYIIDKKSAKANAVETNDIN